ncbi:MAG: hypothetical protein EZS28_050149 [Streblomastix strix]|uniref:Uncharacterized protein n=1 Tax=Streblomastix strix TaxID=222440 RepID=A0A5J4T7H1_9EUKA|nr:MAG: hypothetical protein EZS28_050149 [Streblomastix strix]
MVQPYRGQPSVIISGTRRDINYRYPQLYENLQCKGNISSTIERNVPACSEMQQVNVEDTIFSRFYCLNHKFEQPMPAQICCCPPKKQ